MPSTFIRPDDPDVVFDDDLVYILGGAAGLRRDYGGTDELAAEAVLELPNVTITALDRLWAVAPAVANIQDIEGLWDGVLQPEGALNCTLSVDDGATWLYWDGATWAPAGPADWMSFSDLNANLLSIPFGPIRQLKLRVRLVRGGPLIGPVFCGVRFGYALIPDHLTEDPHRTIRRFFAERVRINFRTNVVFPAGTDANYVGPQVLPMTWPVTLAAVASVYNLTSDPTRQTNLYAGTFAGQNVDLTAAPTAGDLLEVTWEGTVPAELAHKDLDLNDETVRHVPQLLLQVVGSEEALEARLPHVFGDYTVNRATDEYWNERHALPIDYRINVFALAADESLAIKVANAAYRTLRDFSSRRALRMVMAGTVAEALDFIPPFASLTDTSEHLSVKQFTFILYVKEWFGEVLTGPLARELETQITLMEA